jgi:hypothetical protein
MAWEVLTRRVAKINTEDLQLVNLPSIGKDWVKRFSKRYPALKMATSRSMEAA